MKVRHGGQGSVAVDASRGDGEADARSAKSTPGSITECAGARLANFGSRLSESLGAAIEASATGFAGSGDVHEAPASSRATATEPEVVALVGEGGWEVFRFLRGRGGLDASYMVYLPRSRVEWI